ncbi:hypothetical protein BC831DRAFT_436099 [Entophlyctis helioformis]|nr:hypothetical protein BC831DRAFT_436099 [Entophlyctis helioformis]
MTIKVFNVLLVGETGAGKTTLIKALHNFAGVEVPTSFWIGDGNSSTTQTCTRYSILIHPKTALLGKVGKRLDVDSLLAKLLKDAERKTEAFNLKVNKHVKKDIEDLPFNLFGTFRKEPFTLNMQVTSCHAVIAHCGASC